jgi:hypothetical protein
MNKKESIQSEKDPDYELSRKEWLIKAGKYSIFTAASMMMILHPSRVAAQPSLTKPGDGSTF